MKTIPSTYFRSKRNEAFALPDLLVILAVISVLAALSVTIAISVKEKARLAVCLENQQKIGKAILAFSEDNSKALPGPSSPKDNIWWTYKEQIMSYAGLKGDPSVKDTLFACPNDRGYTDSTPFCRSSRFQFNSYVFNGVTLPGMPNVAGCFTYNIKEPDKTLLIMEFCAHGPYAWHYSKNGNQNTPFYNNAQSMAAFVDGHAHFTKFYYDGYNAAYTKDPPPGYDYKFSGN